MKVHHIGYLVQDIDKAVKAFADLGYTPGNDQYRDQEHGIDIRFLENGEYRIELVSPVAVGKTSIVSSLLRRFGNSPYHICYEVDNLTEEIHILEEKHFSLMIAPYYSPAFPNKHVAFLINPRIGIVELLENNHQP